MRAEGRRRGKKRGTAARADEPDVGGILHGSLERERERVWFPSAIVVVLAKKRVKLFL